MTNFSVRSGWSRQSEHARSKANVVTLPPKVPVYSNLYDEVQYIFLLYEIIISSPILALTLVLTFGGFWIRNWRPSS